MYYNINYFFFQAEDGIRDRNVTGVQTCALPISKELGTRHRAAMGISEVTDAITIVVSEETGYISATKNGELRRDMSGDVLRDYLSDNLSINMKSAAPPFRKRGKKNG